MTELRQTTLDEAISTTIWRDVKKVFIKLGHVLIPRTFSHKAKGVEALRDWDLWGPLLICLLLAVLLYTDASSQGQLVFALVFVVVWIGAIIVTLNCMLLGGDISFFQSVCLLGYCVFPIMVAAFICKLSSFGVKGELSVAILILHFVVVGVAFAWSTLSSVGFLAGMVPPNRKILATYPVLLFYFVLSWLILMNYSGNRSNHTPTAAPANPTSILPPTHTPA
eukprot:TRINITY_DN3758_c0_g1_i1.p1 TRINITY_DN3758_c0_g1~~TRINITY_DN3758_c0_g1_i1.p1  ORF type:complete len:223 (-),score=26.39 TRINITY_DN3758_c0_g1_i1:38-706(-)